MWRWIRREYQCAKGKQDSPPMHQEHRQGDRRGQHSQNHPARSPPLPSRCSLLCQERPAMTRGAEFLKSRALRRSSSDLRTCSGGSEIKLRKQDKLPGRHISSSWRVSLSRQQGEGSHRSVLHQEPRGHQRYTRVSKSAR